MRKVKNSSFVTKKHTIVIIFLFLSIFIGLNTVVVGSHQFPMEKYPGESIGEESLEKHLIKTRDERLTPEEAPQLIERSIDWFPYLPLPPYRTVQENEIFRNTIIQAGNALFHYGAEPLIPKELRKDSIEYGEKFVIAHVMRNALSAGWREELESKSIKVLNPVYGDAYLIKVPSSSLEVLKGMKAIDWIGEYHPAYKINPTIGKISRSPEFLESIGKENLGIRILLHPRETCGDVMLAIQESGVQEIIRQNDGQSRDDGLYHPDGRRVAYPTSYIDVTIAIADAPVVIPLISKLESVSWITSIPEHILFSDETAQSWVMNNTANVISGDWDAWFAAREPWDNGLYGLGVVIAIVDSGIMTVNSYLSYAPPSPAMSAEAPNGTGKIPIYHVAPGPGAAYPNTDPAAFDTHYNYGHGTSVAGFAALDPWGDYSIGTISGMCPKCQIWHYDIGSCERGYLTGLYYLTDLYNEMMDMGDPTKPTGNAALVAAVNHSWGASTIYREYNEDSEVMDTVAWNSRLLLPVIAAGNSGPNNDTVTPPGTAKSGLTVGGSDDNDTSPPGPDGMYNESSRGYTSDNRIKPEVTAPAAGTGSAPYSLTHILASTSSIESCTNNNIVGYIAIFEGTSFAAPIVTGLVGLVQNYFGAGLYPFGIGDVNDAFAPTNDLMRGMIINTGERMGTMARPGRDQGWGRVKLGTSLYFNDSTTTNEPHLLVLLSTFPETNPATDTFAFDVNSTTHPVRVTLTWTDWPGDSSDPTSVQIVNDLNLHVQPNSSSSYYPGNYFSTSHHWSRTGTTVDNRNTVENVFIRTSDVVTGRHTIRVIPNTIADGGFQDYSIVVTGDIRGCDLTTELPITDMSTSGDDVVITWDIAPFFADPCYSTFLHCFKVYRNTTAVGTTWAGSWTDVTVSDGDFSDVNNSFTDVGAATDGGTYYYLVIGLGNNLAEGPVGHYGA